MTLLTLCRFDDEGNLHKGQVDIEATEYLTISHIWANAVWRTGIPGILGEVLASDHKVGFLQNKLPELVGQDWFWMDILCVDQRSDQARIEVVKNIPELYRRAQKTIVVREPGGIQSCCAEAVGTFKSWNKEGASKFATHIRKAHFGGLIETWLQRLWPLQEMILSENLLFTVCEDPNFKVPEVDVYDSQLSFRRTSDGIYCAAQAWVTYGLEGQGDEWEYNLFIKAIFNDGFVSRRPVKEDRHRTRPLINDFAIHCNSLRVTSKPRDFILAVLPQYGWYKPPPAVRSMSFGELWLDSYNQAVAAGFGYFPVIVDGMAGEGSTSKESRSPTRNVPEPLYLGDFIKMFGCTFTESDEQAWGTFIAPVILEEPDYDNMEETIKIIGEAMRFSTSEWQLAHRGDLSVYGMFPMEDTILDTQLKIIKKREEGLDEMTEAARSTFLEKKQKVLMELNERERNPAYYETEAIKVLNAMWAGLFEEDNMAKADWRDLQEDLLRSPPFHFAESMIRCAALVSCNLGLSMLRWSETVQLRPFITQIGSFRLLLLAKSNCVCGKKENQGYWCVQRGIEGVSGRDIVLVDSSNFFVVGKFPEFSRKTIGVEENVARLKLIYPEEQLWVMK